MRTFFAGLLLVVAVTATPAAAQDTEPTNTTTTIVLSAPSTSITVEEPPVDTVDLSAPSSTVPTEVAGVQETNPARTAPALAQTGTNTHMFLLGLALVAVGAVCLAVVGGRTRSIP